MLPSFSIRDVILVTIRTARHTDDETNLNHVFRDAVYVR